MERERDIKNRFFNSACYFLGVYARGFGSGTAAADGSAILANTADANCHSGSGFIPTAVWFCHEHSTAAHLETGLHILSQSHPNLASFLCRIF